MLKKTALILIILAATGSVGYAQWAVIDGTAADNFAKQFTEVGKQVKAAEAQLKQAQDMFNSVTGNRGLGSLFPNSVNSKLLPKNMEGIYSELEKNGISGSVNKILNEEKLSGSVEDMAKSIDERQRQSAAAQKALGLKAYANAQQRLDQIETLRQKIGETGDQKAIGELQARLQVEQAAIQSETNKLQLLQQMQVNEDKLIDVQRQQLNRKILSNKNSQSPSFN